MLVWLGRGSDGKLLVGTEMMWPVNELYLNLGRVSGIIDYREYGR